MSKSVIQLGAALGIIGIGSLLLPMVLPVVSPLYMGTLLILAGMSYLIRLMTTYSKQKWMVGLFCWTYFLAGGLFLLNPSLGIHSTKVFLIVFFLTEGNLKFILSSKLAQVNPVWPATISGASSFLLLGLLWVGWPDSSFKNQERFVGIHLVVTGWAWMMIGLISKMSSRKISGTSGQVGKVA